MVLTKASRTTTSGDGILTLEVKGARRSFRLLDPTHVGQDSSCQVRLFGPSVASVHCEIRRERKDWVIEVEPMAESIALNGNLTRRAILQEGDEILVAGVRLEFGLADGSTSSPGRRSSAVEATTSNGVDSVTLARSWAELQIEWAKWTAEREASQAHLEAARARNEEERRSIEKLREETTLALEMERARIESESAAVRLDLENRARDLDLREQLISWTQMAFEEEESTRQVRVADWEKEFQRQMEQAKRSQESAQRLLVLAHAQREEARRQRESLRKQQEEWKLQQQQIAEELRTRKEELTGISARIGRERATLTQLQREQSRIWTAQSDRIPSSSKGRSADVIDVAGERPSSESPVEWSALAAVVGWLEESLELVELADRRHSQERARLAQYARLIEVRERELLVARDSQSAAAMEELASRIERDRREQKIDRGRLEAAKAAFVTERAAVMHQLAMEWGNLDRERERVAAQRARVAHSHRRRLAVLRSQRSSIRSERRELDQRFSRMLRFEARLETLKADLMSRHLAWLSDRLKDPKDRSLVSIENGYATCRVMEEELETGRQRYGARLERILEILDRDAPGETHPNRNGSGSSTEQVNAQLELEISLLEAQLAANGRQWESEKRAFEDRIVLLERQVENLAGSLVAAESPAGPGVLSRAA